MGAPRWNGAWGKKQVCRPHVWIYGLFGLNVLYWRKSCDQVRTFRRPQWFRSRGIVPTVPCPLFSGYTPCVTRHCSAQLWNSPSPGCRTTSLHWETTATLVRPCVQNTPQKPRRGTSCWLNPLESGPEAVKGQGGVTTSSPLPSLVWVWSQQNYLRLLLTMRYSKSS